MCTKVKNSSKQCQHVCLNYYSTTIIQDDHYVMFSPLFILAAHVRRGRQYLSQSFCWLPAITASMVRTGTPALALTEKLFPTENRPIESRSIPGSRNTSSSASPHSLNSSFLSAFKKVAISLVTASSVP